MEYIKFPEDGRVRHLVFLMTVSTSDIYADASELTYTSVGMGQLNEMLEAKWKVRTHSVDIHKRAQGGFLLLTGDPAIDPRLEVMDIEYDAGSWADVTVPDSGDTHKIKPLVRLVEEANGVLESIIAHVLSTGDLLVRDSLYKLTFRPGDSIEHVTDYILEAIDKEALEDAHLEDLVDQHVDYLMKEANSSYILKALAEARLNGLEDTAGCQFLQRLRDMAEREYEDDQG